MVIQTLKLGPGPGNYEGLTSTMNLLVSLSEPLTPRVRDKGLEHLIGCSLYKCFKVVTQFKLLPCHKLSHVTTFDEQAATQLDFLLGDFHYKAPCERERDQGALQLQAKHVIFLVEGY